MRYLFLIPILIITSGCSVFQGETATNTVTITPSNSQGCSSTPTDVLDSKNVKQVTLTNEEISVSGMVRQNQSQGFTFEANSGQKLTYQTEQNICVWVYTPDNQLLNSGTLPQSGNYIVQVAAQQGSTTFDLQMGLDVPQAVASATSQVSPTPTVVKRVSPDEFVRDHYLALNDRNYRETWDHLSPNFKNIAVSYSEYQKWWNSVREIRIGNIETVKENEDNAIVNAELWYVMNTGKLVKDSKSRIYLIWNESEKSWLFNNKV